MTKLFTLLALLLTSCSVTRYEKKEVIMMRFVLQRYEIMHRYDGDKAWRIWKGENNQERWQIVGINDTLLKVGTVTSWPE